MTVIVTMAGAGSRFAREGFSSPKHMIQARGRTLFEWSISSLSAFNDQHFIFAARTDHDADWITQTARQMGIARLDVMSRSDLSRGQAETAYDCLTQCDSGPLWIYNIDTYIERGLAPTDMGTSEGCIHVFESNSPSMSYVSYSSDGKVDRVAEKKVISNWASVGVYGFINPSLYKDLYLRTYPESDHSHEVNGERYIAPMYQLLLAEQGSVVAPKLENKHVHILGTPAEVRVFDPDLHVI